MIGRRLLPFLVVALAAGLLATGCSDTVSDAATVKYPESAGGETQHISREEFQGEMSHLISNKSLVPLLSQSFAIKEGDDESTDAKLTAWWLTQLIRDKVVDAEFAVQRLSLKPEYTEQAEKNLKEKFTEPVFSAFPKKLRDKLVASNARFLAVLQSCPSDRLVSHILVPTEAEANAALAKIRGGTPFTTVAEEDSTDGSAVTGGLLGCLAPEAYVPEFQQAAEKAAFDSVTAPVKTEFGYHLIQVRHWDPRIAVTQQVSQGLQDAGLAALNERLNDVDVWVDPRYGSWGAQDTENGKVLSVQPPVVPAPRDAARKG